MRSLLNRYSQSPAVRDSHGNSSQPNKIDTRILHESRFPKTTNKSLLRSNNMSPPNALPPLHGRGGENTRFSSKCSVTEPEALHLPRCCFRSFSAESHRARSFVQHHERNRLRQAVSIRTTHCGRLGYQRVPEQHIFDFDR